MNLPPTSKLMLDWYAQPGFVYFFKAGDAVKIGVAGVSKGKTIKDAVVRRMKQVQSANHEQIELLGIIPFETGDEPTRAAQDREKQLLAQFSDTLRFKQHSVGAEWFDCTDPLLTYIKENAKTPGTLGVAQTVAISAPPRTP